MEALVILIAELLVPPLLLGLVALLEALMLGAQLVFELILNRTFPWRPARAPSGPRTDGPVTAPRPRPRWLKPVRIGVVSVVGLTITAALVANFVFFEGTLRWALGQVESRTGIAITFTEARGNLLTGRVELQGVSIERLQSDKSTFDLQAERMGMNIGMLGVLGSEIPIASLRIEGMEGTYDRLQVPDRLEPRHEFCVDDFALERVKVTVTDHTRGIDPLILPLEIETWRSQPLRSRWAVFDALFRSNVRGAVAGTPFLIETREIPDGRETLWRVEALPVDVAATYLRGPMAWLERGTIDVEVVDRWRIGESVEIEMDWSLVFSGLHGSVPEDLPLPLKTLARPVVAYLNEHGERLPLSFSLVIDEDSFEGSASLEAAGLWDTASEALTTALAQVSGVDQSRIRELGTEGLDRLKGLLNRRRRGK